MSKNAINITVPFVHNDKPYAGVTLHAGVNLSSSTDLCVETLKFDNTVDPPTGILLHGVTAIEIAAQAFRPYLQLKPTVKPAVSK